MGSERPLKLDRVSVQQVLKLLYGGEEGKAIIDYTYDQVMQAIDVLVKTVNSYKEADNE